MKKLLIVISLFMFSMMVKAGDSFYTDLEPLKLTTPEMKPELVLR